MILNWEQVPYAVIAHLEGLTLSPRRPRQEADPWRSLELCASVCMAEAPQGGAGTFKLLKPKGWDENKDYHEYLIYQLAGKSRDSIRQCCKHHENPEELKVHAVCGRRVAKEHVFGKEASCPVWILKYFRTFFFFKNLSARYKIKTHLVPEQVFP